MQSPQEWGVQTVAGSDPPPQHGGSQFGTTLADISIVLADKNKSDYQLLCKEYHQRGRDRRTNSTHFIIPVGLELYGN